MKQKKPKGCNHHHILKSKSGANLKSQEKPIIKHATNKALKLVN